jgi:HK97 family phage portal protein
MIRRLLSTKAQETRDISFSDIWRKGLDVTTLNTVAGEPVTYDTAMSLSAVYASIRLLADTVSSLDVDVYFRRGAAELRFRPLPQFVKQMSRHLTNVEVINQIVVSLLLDGNAYMATARDATGRVLFVDILDPTLITPKIETSEDGSQRLTYTSTQAPEIVYTGRDITMFRNLLKPGQIKGVSPITAAREMLSLGIAQQSYASSMYGNGALPGGLVEVQGQLSETGVAQLKQGFNDLHQGARNGHRLAVLTEGAKFSQVALNPADAKWIEGSQATVRDIARLFGLPPFLLADASGSTSWGSGIAEMNLAMQVYSLRPIVRRLEATLNGVLRSMGIEVAYFNIDLNRMSRHHPDRWSDYSTAIHSGILSINEARAWEGLSPVEDGDKHFIPLNLAPIDEERP